MAREERWEVSHLFRGRAIRLAALSPEDAETMASWQEDPVFLRRLDAEVAFPKSSQEMVGWISSRRERSNAFFFGIRPLEGEDLLGFIAIDEIIWNHGSGWVSLAIGRQEDRGKGYGFEALTLAVSFAFRELNLRRLSITVFARNEPAIGLYERAGFQKEGGFREFLDRDGETEDMLLFGLLKREWMDKNG